MLYYDKHPLLANSTGSERENVMRLYLVRHGAAVEESEDPARPLSQTGIDEAQRTGRFISTHFQTNVGSILHSSKMRAAQTAQIMQQHLTPLRGTKQTEGLLPMDDPGIWADRISDMEFDTMLVGHLPHLSRLASTLLCWNSETAIAEFNTGTAACLDGTAGNWHLKWLVGPDVLKKKY
jgi:phosphohistidine phosphatase